MLQKVKILSIVIFGLLLFSGCSKGINEYNKPAIYWYGKIVDSIARMEMDKADSYYSSLQGEHTKSPLLPEATMIIATAHMYEEEYLLAEHFFNEYIKRYASDNQKEYAEFMKIKSKYMALPNPRRDQELIQSVLTTSQEFKFNYPYSSYIYEVDTMLVNIHLAQATLNESIASLYDRIDKPHSAKVYRDIKKEDWINWEEVDVSNTPWYREWFEGDGSSSWYSFLIPDTNSVVSKNSNAHLEKERSNESK